MKHLVVLPYYCNAEIDRFKRLAHIWRTLPQTNIEYEFLLSSRHDIEPSQELEQAYSRIRPTRSMRCSTVGKGHRRSHASNMTTPIGPSAMFWDTLRHVNDNYAKDGGFVLWFESDMLPLTSSWLEVLEREWKDGDHVIMGTMVRGKKVREHINGGACYCKDFYAKFPDHAIDLSRNFDNQIFPYLKDHYAYKAIDQIMFLHNTITLKKMPPENIVLLHGIKDYSAYLYLCKKMNMKLSLQVKLNLFFQDTITRICFTIAMVNKKYRQKFINLTRRFRQGRQGKKA